ncbi:NCS1 family nucleobase:cation symporter-1 [Niallia sp. Sow4_A1]|uniref:NCS1 family nucleobase:cation symporter-1 n=1 Tax=Niallia sp. Sow4_A1 TaxID=3438793 RepID=UPI003F9C70E1
MSNNNIEFYQEKIDQPDSTLYNADLAPTPKAKRNWTAWIYACVWMGIVHNINQWVITANMLDKGMSFWQAFGVTCFAFGIVYVVLILNSFAGAKYGVPFPVLIRSAFGHKAALIPIFIRGVLGIFWFGIFVYLASESIDVAFGAIVPGWEDLSNINFLGMGLNTVIGYTISIILHYLLITHGIERIKKYELWAGPLIMVVAIALVIWAINVAGGLSPLVNIESTIAKEDFWGLFFLSATGIIGTVATLIVNIPDLTRFSRSQKDQIVGQAIGVPIMFIFFSIISLLVTAGTMYAYGGVINDPIHIIERFDNPLVVFIGAIIILASVLSLNAATNAIAVGFDLAALLPQKLNFRKAGIIAIFVGVLSLPWLWYGETAYMDNIMGVLGSTMGPVAGIMLIDFFVIRRQKYEVNSLFVTDGLYAYKDGWNIHAVLAFIIGFIIALSGLIVPKLDWLYAYNWFLGIGTGGLVYWLLMTAKFKKEKNISNNSKITPLNKVEKY